MFEDNKSKAICGGIGGVLLVIAVIFSFSMAAIEPTEYGILYNSFTKSVDTSFGNVVKANVNSLSGWSIFYLPNQIILQISSNCGQPRIFR
jgi:hypothetical protein